MNLITSWLVLLLGLSLSGFGAAVVWFGLDIVQTERGWSQVISGSMGVAGGAIVTALAFVLFKLDAVRRAILESAKPARPAPAPLRDVAPAMPVSVPVEAPASAPVMDAPAPKAAHEDTFPLAGLGAAGAIGAAAVAALAYESVPARADDAVVKPTDAVSHESDFAPAEREPEPAPEPVADPLTPFAGLSAPDTTPLHVSEPPERPAVQAPEPPPAAVAEPPRTPPRLEDLDDDWLNFDFADKAEEPAPALAAPEPPPAAPPARVVARYSASGLEYVMYDDGSIEADDGRAVRRFRDMAELKAHLAGAE